MAAVALDTEYEINTLLEYYRVDARNYANTYTSNATTHYTDDNGNVSSTYMDPTKYNTYRYPTYYTDNDCANYVSQAICCGGVSQNDSWKPGVYNWINVGGLVDYFYSNVGLVKESDFASCNAGGFIVTMQGSSRKHVVMCVLNDTVNHAYSAHTNDRLRAAYTSSYPNLSSCTAKYYCFKITDDGTQYGDDLTGVHG